MNRRRFLKSTALVGTGALILRGRVWPFAQSPTNIRKFVTTLPGLGPSGANNIGQYLPLATKTTSKFAGISTDVYHLGVKKFDEMMHPDLPRSTHFWGYYDLATGDQQYLGGIIVGKRGTPILLNVTNQLPVKALIPTDPTVIAGPNGLMGGDWPLNRIVQDPPWLSSIEFSAAAAAKLCRRFSLPPLCGADAAAPLFLGNVFAEDEAEFKYGPELVRIRSRLAKDTSRRVVRCAHPREIAANVHASLLVGWRCGESGACAASPKAQQIDRSVGSAPGPREVFHARRKREAALEGVADVERAASCGCTRGHAYLRVGRQLAVLEVRRNDPWALGIRIDHRVHVAVVRHRCGRRLIGGLSEVPHPVVHQAMRPLRKGRRAREPRVAVGIVTVVPTDRGGQVLTHGLIHLDAAIDGVFLVPNDAALDVEVLVRKGGLGAHQRRQRADKELGGLSHRKLQIGDRNWPIEIVHGIFRAEKRHAERRHGIGARLD